jgi:hypothetical protein
MDLPNKEKNFHVDHIGADTGKKYDGQFTVLCLLNASQKHAMALEESRLLGNSSNPTDELSGFAKIFANLRAKIVDAPEWWKQSRGGATIEDEDVLVILHQKIKEAELQWKEDLKKKTQAIQENSTSLTP